MTMHGRAAAAALAITAAAMLGACRDRAPAADDAAPPPDSAAKGGSVGVQLAAPAELGWNETDTIRVVVTNTTGAPVRDAVLHLFVQAPAEAAVDSTAPEAQRPQTTASGEGTRLTFAVAALEPGRTAGFVQALRLPPAPSPTIASPSPAPGRRSAAPARPDSTPTRYLLRAWLSTKDGAPIGQPVEDTVAIRAGSDVVVGGCGNVGDVSVTRYGVGPVRIGMTMDALRSACPETRDTTWQAEGTAEKGAVAVPGGQRIVARLADGKVDMIIVDQPGMKTAAGVGVGATVGDLRGRYGRMCAGVGEGRVAVWFPNAPGISFGLDTLATRGWTPAQARPDSISDEVAVGSFWVRQGTDDCPAAAPGAGDGR
jgi:hypothetical protein